MTIHEFEQRLAACRGAYGEGQFAAAAEHLAALLGDGSAHASELLVLQACLSQLVDDGGPHLLPLDRIEAVLAQATRLDPESSSARLELAYFQCLVLNRSKVAQEGFADAQDIAEQHWQDALRGHIECALDAGDVQQARQVFLDARASITRAGFWESLQEDIEAAEVARQGGVSHAT